jgi:hypothetical protein
MGIRLPAIVLENILCGRRVVFENAAVLELRLMMMALVELEPITPHCVVLLSA